MTPSIVVPHKGTVRTYSFITSIIKRFLIKSAKNNLKIMQNDHFKKSKNCPMFNLVKNEKGKVQITIGEYVASNKVFDTFDQAERFIGSKPYELIINLIGITIHYEKSKETANANKENAENTENN